MRTALLLREAGVALCFGASMNQAAVTAVVGHQDPTTQVRNAL